MSEPKKEKWFKTFTGVQIASLLLTVVISSGTFFVTSPTIHQTAIISLLVFLVINFIMFAKVFVEKVDINILELLRISKNSKNDIIYSKNRPDIFDIYNAERCVFISGTTMAFTHDTHYLEKLNGLVDRGIQVTLAISEYEKPCIDNYLKEVFGKTPEQQKRRKGDFEDFKKKFKGKIIYIDIFVPIAYVAVDYDQASTHSIIYTKHYLIKKDSDKADSFYLITYSWSQSFETLSKQINLIIESGGRLSKSRNEAMVNKE